ncbi:amino acid ABC transporter ATP-binding protein [Clostridium felsineum]|uniref:L-cystine import ATP-binding protein TcyC n=1 Tax=Clostridium felsineum TaxID=36839 RepID=A0A1S8M9J5_9CLOT|nr:amino acid ABC transporter ATP-binding protein [Clostridium felsineum]URZ08437.1 L-cystine import ATP-binding protein TcyC [Clostridium felsineum]URZ13468.1 L-cystine import ATP-binding protein TcyC [Clostridium felsineum]
MITISNLHKSFGKAEILKGIDLKVNKGETTVIIGPSGSGKTTLLRCINLLEKPNIGSIDIDNLKLEFGTNKNVYTNDIIKLRKKTGMVFQGFYLFPHMTVLQNIMEGQLTVLKRSKNVARDRGITLLDKVGLAEKKDQYPHELSGGQQQRVAIARAMAMDPEVLLFDEPTSALDPELEAEVLKVMKELSNEGMTMIVVTHKMSFARDAAHKVVFMDNGLIIDSGSPEHIFKTSTNPRLNQFLNIVNN